MNKALEKRTGSPLLSLWRRLGPGLVTGAADDDPSGIATHSQIGAQFGFGLSWTFLFSFPLMVVIQEVAAEIGSVTGRGIAHNLRRHYSPWLLRGVVTLLLVANIINLGADLGAMGTALELLLGGPGQLYILSFGIVCIVLEVWLSYPRYAAILDDAFAVLLCRCCICGRCTMGYCAEVLIRSQRRPDRSVRDGNGSDPRYDH